MGDIMINDIVTENLMKAIMDYKKKNGINATRYEFDSKIISMNNPMLSYFFKLIIGSNKNEHDVIVSKSNDISLIYNYAVKCKDIDTILMEESLLSFKGLVNDETYLKFLLLFLKDVPCCDKERIKREIHTIKRERKI